MRLGMGILAVATALVTSACGSSEPSVSANELFGEYVRSTDVKNDRFLSTGSSEDRMSNFAAYYTPEQLQAVVLRTFECGDGEPVNPEPSNRCELNGAINSAARNVAGGELYGRSVIVKHEDGSLELVTLYVVQGSEESVLVDRIGHTYTGLEDFRAKNDLLTADDTMLTLRDITSVPGEGEIVTITGHTPPTWQWWLLGGVAVVFVLGAVIVVVRRRADARFDATLDPDSDPGAS